MKISVDKIVETNTGRGNGVDGRSVDQVDCGTIHRRTLARPVEAAAERESDRQRDDGGRIWSVMNIVANSWSQRVLSFFLPFGRLVGRTFVEISVHFRRFPTIIGLFEGKTPN